MMRKAAVLFAVFVFGVIVLADLGILRGTLVFVNDVPLLDKFLHFLLIGTLTFLVIGALVETFPLRSPLRIALGVVAALLAVFTLEEFSQGPIPGRDASLLDLASNYAGIFFFGFLAWMWYRRRGN